MPAVVRFPSVRRSLGAGRRPNQSLSARCERRAPTSPEIRAGIDETVYRKAIAIRHERLPPSGRPFFRRIGQIWNNQYLLEIRVEKTLVDEGVLLLKYSLQVSPDEQRRRLEARIDDGRKFWKLSDMDLKSYSHWHDYSRARDDIFRATDTWAPWYVVHSDDKRRARLNTLTHILSKIPYKELPREKIKLPMRHERGGYKESDYPFTFIPEVF